MKTHLETETGEFFCFCIYSVHCSDYIGGMCSCLLITEKPLAPHYKHLRCFLSLRGIGMSEDNISHDKGAMNCTDLWIIENAYRSRTFWKCLRKLTEWVLNMIVFSQNRYL